MSVGGDGNDYTGIFGQGPTTGGNSIGVYGRPGAAYADAIGVYGEGEKGVYGIAPTYGGYGVFGRGTGDHSYGVFGRGTYTGVYGRGDIYDFYAESSSGKSYFAGKVGIGTQNPQSKLAVNGTITAKEIEVQLEGWPDFVFEDNYKLMPLNKLEKHIKKEKSLPGIPTSKEAVEEGLKLGEMQAKLLEKVEELTLYVINQNKELTELKKEVGNLREENKELRQEISSSSN